MGQEELRKLRGYRQSLLSLQQLFERLAAKHENCEDAPVKTLSQEIVRINADFSDLLPPFRHYEFHSHSSGNTTFYKTSGILSYLAIALARLEASIDPAQGAPVTEDRAFPFVQDRQLR